MELLQWCLLALIDFLKWWIFVFELANFLQWRISNSGGFLAVVDFCSGSDGLTVVVNFGSACSDFFCVDRFSFWEWYFFNISEFVLCWWLFS